MMKVLALMISLILSGLLVGCVVVPEEAPEPAIEVTDQLGRVVRLETIPQRIVSLAPSNTEILYALGLADRLVAVTDFCNYPPEAREKPSIGGFSTPNIEEIVALSPDLILATSIHEKRVIPQLESKGLVVFALAPKTIDEVLEAITLTGKITGTERNASTLVADMRQRIAAVTDRVSSLSHEKKPGAFYVVWHEPLMIAGLGTLQDDLIGKAGGVNMGGGTTGYAEISLEAVIAANPDVMIIGVGMGSGQNATSQFVETETRLRDIAARINNRIYAIDSDLTSRAGPRIVNALEQFAIFLNPELLE